MGWGQQLRIDSEEESNGWIVGFLWRVFYREKWYLGGLMELLLLLMGGWCSVPQFWLDRRGVHGLYVWGNPCFASTDSTYFAVQLVMSLIEHTVARARERARGG